MTDPGERFTAKVYRTILYTWALAMVWSIALGKPWIAVSLTLGMAVATVSVVSLEWVIRRRFVPGAVKPGAALVKLSCVKLPLMCLFLYLLVRYEKISPAAFCGGVALVHFAILAKMAGIRLSAARRRPGTLAGRP